MVKYMTFTVVTIFLSVQFCVIKYIHNVMQPSPPFLSRIFTSS